MRHSLVPLVIVLFALCRATCATYVRSVAFGDDGVVRFAAHAAPRDAFLCTTRACVDLPPNATSVRVALRADGDVVRVVDARLRTLQWIAWGHPTGAWDLQHSEALVRAPALARVWAVDTRAWRGIAWAEAHWERAAFDTRDCLRDGAYARAGGGVALLQLEASERTRLVLRDWIAPTLACDAWSGADAADDVHDTAFWRFVAARNNQSCSVTQTRAHALAALQCMHASALPRDGDAHGWPLPFDPYARFVSDTDARATTWFPQKRVDWEEHWRDAFGAVPLLLCRAIELDTAADAVAFHSIVFVMHVDGVARATLSPVNASPNDAVELRMPATVVPCPPWFFA